MIFFQLKSAANPSGKVLVQLSTIPNTQLIPSLIEKHLSELAADKYKYKVPEFYIDYYI